MDDLLFYSLDMHAVIENQKRGLADDINSLTENDVLGTSQEDMVKYLIGKWVINPLTVDESKIRTDYGDASVDVSRDFHRFIIDRSRPYYIQGSRFRIRVPFTGDADLFKCKPSTFNLNPPRGKVEQSELVFTYDLTVEDREKVRELFQRDLENTTSYINWVNGDVEGFNRMLQGEVRQKLSARREKLLKDREVVASLGFPLSREKDPPKTFVTPNVQSRATPPKPTASSKPFQPEPELKTDEYEHILAICKSMVAVMERSPRAFKDMEEEDLRTHFLVQLNGQYEGQATGETFNYEGKTDILIREDGKNIFIAECKFWKGPSGLKDALDQLLGYVAWRDTKVALLIFNRDRNTSTVLERVPATACEHPKFKTELPSDSETEFRYIFGHRDDDNREMVVTILVFDVPA